MMKVLLELLTNDYTAENTLLVAEKTHDSAGGDGDERMESRGGEAMLRSRLPW